MAGPPRYVYVADDFTGATDTLATLARTGLAVRLFLDVPPPDEVRHLDAFGIATEARALGTSEVETLMREIGTRLAPHHPEILHLKICSTFDSAPDTGNFARGMAALAQGTGLTRRAIIGGQPSLGRYCIFGNLFARAADGAVYRIDRHPVMRAHPVTPMTESDLATHVLHLGGPRPRLVDQLSLGSGISWADHETVLFDALDAQDIDRIGAHLRAAAPILCAGSSSVAEAVAGAAPPRRPDSRTIGAPILGFAGSRSAVSADQVARAERFTRIPVAPGAIIAPAGRQAVGRSARAALSRGEHVLLHLDDRRTPGLSSLELARHCATLVASILAHGAAGALVVAGGDTSSAIVRRLRPRSIAFDGDIDRGVPLCTAAFDGQETLPIVLKGGQMGGATLFDDIANGILAGARRPA